MIALISRIAIVGSIMKKDLIEFARDRLWILLSTLGLVCYVAIFWVLPSTVDETITLGIRQTGLNIALQEIIETEEEGLEIVLFESSERLKAAVAGEIETEKEVRIGIDFPDDFLTKTLQQEKTIVQVYVEAGVPREISRAISSMVREIAYMISGDDLPVTQLDQQTIVLGEDRVGNQVPFRDKMRPMLAFFILIVEAFALASLIAGEVQAKTVTAMLVTPARTGDVLAAKTILGTLLAFTQALVLLLAVNALGEDALLMILIILLGALMVAGIGMITGSAGKDFMGTLMYGMIFMLLLVIPAFAVLFPGMASTWVKILPSYGIVEGMVRTTIYGKGWAESVPYLAHIAFWDTIILGSGLLVLKKKVETL
ncbi:MAG: ABC transporter permease [Desulfobacteraceae bacterium]|nr:ABC transporter permease [Desulfobacteraceae bacterium]